MTTNDARLKVLIADDSAGMRDRLATRLGALPAVEIAALTGSIRETLVAVCRHRPDVVILDTRLSDGTPLDVLRQMREARLESAVLVATDHSEMATNPHDSDPGREDSSEFCAVADLVARLAAQQERIDSTRN